MTHHLSDEQLGATRDGALAGAAALAADRHLAECAACRERLDEIATLDAALAGALEHDPGEAYFASFADRVGARIASAAPVTAAAAAPRRGLATWWDSPRRLAWAGGALGLVAVAALVVTLAREHGPQEMARQVTPSRELGVKAEPPRELAANTAPPRADRAAKSLAVAGSGAPRRAAAPAPIPAPDASAPPEDSAPPTFAASTARDEAAAPPKTQAEGAAPQRAMEVRTLPNGEQEAVLRQPQATPPPAPALKLPGGFSKPAASPLGGQPIMRQSLTGGAEPATGAAAAVTGALERKAAPAHPAPAALAADALGGQPMRISRDGGASETVSNVAICGQVRDARGRPAARALVTVAETGRMATAGPDGAFCVDIPNTGGTLAVLAVGYRPNRMSVSAADISSPVSVTLSAVDVVMPSAKTAGGVFMYTDEPTRNSTPGNPSMARRAAIAASAAALRAATADAWTVAAQRWETVALLEPATSDAEPGFHVAEARVNAWLVGRADTRRADTLRAAARKATQVFLDHATDGPSLDIARGWYRVLER